MRAASILDALRVGVGSISGGVHSLKNNVGPAARRAARGAGGALRSLGFLRGLALTALVLAAGWIVAGLVWQVAFPPVRSAPAPAVAPAAERPTPAELAERGIIIEPELTFFGVPEAVEEALPPSTGPFQLAGIMLSSDNAASRAIVRVDGVDRIFAVGERLPGGAVIDLIGASSVILRTESGRETLALPKENFSAPPAAENPIAQSPLLAALPDSSAPPAEAATNVSRSLFSDREAMFAMIAGIETSLVGSDAGAAGLRLDKLGTVEVLRQVGFRDGDIVTEVNGLPVRGAESFAKILESVQAGTSISLVIYRDGQLTRKSINIVDNN